MVERSVDAWVVRRVGYLGELLAVCWVGEWVIPTVANWVRKSAACSVAQMVQYEVGP